MSTRDNDRKVSKPTEADFAHGIASSYGSGMGSVAGFIAGLALSYLVGKAGRK